MNIFEAQNSEETLAELFRLLSQPGRLQILLAIGEGEACVCHLEVALGQRQAYISQQMMALRDAGLVVPLRDGRNIYYRLATPRLLALIHQAAGLLNGPELPSLALSPLEGCTCPHCEESRGLPPEQTRKICCS